eukprot:662519-Amphidinium_carterae.1
MPPKGKKVSRRPAGSLKPQWSDRAGGSSCSIWEHMEAWQERPAGQKVCSLLATGKKDCAFHAGQRLVIHTGRWRVRNPLKIRVELEPATAVGTGDGDLLQRFEMLRQGACATSRRESLHEPSAGRSCISDGCFGFWRERARTQAKAQVVPLVEQRQRECMNLVCVCLTGSQLVDGEALLSQ